MKNQILKVAGGCSLGIAIILLLFFDMKNPLTAGFVVYFVLLSVILIFVSIRRVDLENRVEKIKKENETNAFYQILKNYDTDAFGPVFFSKDEQEEFYKKIRKISKRDEDRYQKQEKLRQCLKLVESESEEVANEFMEEAVGILKYLIRNHIYEEKEEWSKIKNTFFLKQEAFETNKIINKAEAFLNNAKSQKELKEALFNAKAIIEKNLDERPQNINREKIDNYLADLDARFGKPNTEATVETEKNDNEQQN